MTPAQLQALVAVLECGTFSDAALELGVAQSSVSRSVAELERELGAKLLRRGRHGAQATEVGLRVAVHARKMLALCEGMRQEAALSRGELRGQLRVFAFPSIVRQLVGELLVTFAGLYPRVKIELHEEEPVVVERALRDGLADVGFALLPTLPELISFEVSRDRCVGVVPQSWPGTSLRQDDLTSNPFILYDDPVCERMIVGYMEELVGPVVPSFRLHENATIISLVARGLGFSIMAEQALHPGDGVRAVALPTPLDRVTGVALRPEGLAMPTIKAFLAILRQRGLGTSPVLAGHRTPSAGEALPQTA